MGVPVAGSIRQRPDKGPNVFELRVFVGRDAAGKVTACDLTERKAGPHAPLGPRRHALPSPSPTGLIAFHFVASQIADLHTSRAVGLPDW